ncbi:glycoside hydrolase family 125 protein [Sphingomonas sp. 2R-10]|uniref:glycoside hydrolase family 125 protein n=1 Tax=Sphingomonas sp. 2R-10 TaxID=3045148 RepID=UPI000F78ABB3|nr:glycoside hydrolase family 125 protein [Sphingomonas sp. 2R-10]MDJ0275655.1 glycoside hydrolase family 125 protein [Sphingomonas sp. 2R-10]
MLTDRRNLMTQGALLGAGLATGALAPIAVAQTRTAPAGGYVSKRPAPADRRFVSPAVEREIARVSRMIADPEVACLFANAYPNTLDTTVKMGRVDGKPDSFVITGDIPCLWLRDSAAQVKSYLHLAKQDAKLRELFRGLIARHARSVLIDPYANAFMEDPTAKTNLEWSQVDETEMKPGVAERKWEIDSLCYSMRLSHGYWAATRDATPFDAQWADAMRAIVRTFREQQRKDGPGPYKFQRASRQPTETLLAGYGAPTRKVGMIHSGFRPSDDACQYPLFVPANMFAVTTLREMAQVANEARKDSGLANDATALANEVAAAVAQYGTMKLPDGRDVWAYEVDGFGNAIFMDDANVPSLSSLAWLGCVPAGDARWQRTAAAAWSDANPWFFKGTAGEGIGGPHQGMDYIWPMSLIVRGLTATDDATILKCLATLKRTHAGTGFMHEAFEKDDASKFTRSWFAWANGLFGEFILHLAATKPQLLKAPLDAIRV